MELVGLPSGLTPPEKIEREMLEEERIGEEELKKFITELQNDRLMPLDFYAPIKWLRVCTFASRVKTIMVKTSSKDIQFSTERYPW
jgi:hypothetical protein